ncbi:AAA family ATPase [Crocosphaera sp. XPORK-15E]|uniref:AAA family ATPase n=1 Tax=Crocosphaera sp. XPORK-15E TaxID=3110247 RepID=UPI002B1FAA89|nr:AAA family ATPase [Crocosphaera sp. XPORK-15E]MEA5536776.1 AAA family ATPase [Crocosphaera sp. XPORK-15E]
MITSLELKNFTAFRSLEIDFSPKINVIIGENGTGKTHLLKAAYTLSSGYKLFSKQSSVEASDLKNFLTERLIRLFLPLDNKLGKLHHTGAEEKAECTINFSLEQMLKISFFNNSQFVNIMENQNYKQYQKIPVFIPTKESLSFMEGMLSLYDRYKMTFDETYRDIWSLLDLPVIRSENLHEKSKWAIEEIESICGGKFIFYGGGRVNFKVKNIEYSANAIAEGFRKIGILSRLLETGAIQPGISGALFWDEPEGSINPKLMKLLVKILLELSRNGQQIIIATHDYVSLKWFDLLIDEQQEDEIIYHSLYREPENKELKVHSTKEYLEIYPNPIDEAFEALINAELDKTMGDLGR